MDKWHNVSKLQFPHLQMWTKAIQKVNPTVLGEYMQQRKESAESINPQELLNTWWLLLLLKLLWFGLLNHNVNDASNLIHVIIPYPLGHWGQVHRILCSHQYLPSLPPRKASFSLPLFDSSIWELMCPFQRQGKRGSMWHTCWKEQNQVQIQLSESKAYSSWSLCHAVQPPTQIQVHPTLIGSKNLPKILVAAALRCYFSQKDVCGEERQDHQKNLRPKAMPADILGQGCSAQHLLDCIIKSTAARPSPSPSLTAQHAHPPSHCHFQWIYSEAGFAAALSGSAGGRPGSNRHALGWEGEKGTCCDQSGNYYLSSSLVWFYWKRNK